MTESSLIAPLPIPLQAWILGRSPTISAESLQAAKDAYAHFGINVDMFLPMPQVDCPY